MMRKKLVSVLLTAAMCVSLTACGGGGGSSSSGDSGDSGSSGGGSSSDALQVVIWDNYQQPGIQEICDLFTEETGIKAKVEVKDWDSYWTLLEAGASGGDMPDVFWMHCNNSQIYMNNDMLLNLDEYIEKSDVINMDNYMPEVTELYTHNDSIYAIPKDYDTIALWYNKKMFDDEGLDYPDSSWTWDDFYDAAKKLTHDGQYGFAMNTTNEQDSYYNMIYSMGGTILTDDKKSGYDDPNTLKAMDFVGKVLKDCCPSATTMAETMTDALMQSGTVAMVTQGSWMVSGFKENDVMTENCDVAILPYDKETGVRASICNGLGWAAPANTDRADDSWALIEWFGSEEMQKKQAELGVTMSAFEGTSDAWVNCTDSFNLQPYLDITEESKDEGVTNELVLRPYTYNSTRWTEQAKVDLVPAWNDPSKMEETCKQFAKTMNDLIASESN